MPKQGFRNIVASEQRAQVEMILALWGNRAPWNATAAQLLKDRLIKLIYTIAAPRIPDVRSGEAAATLLRGALGASNEVVE